MKLTEKRKQKQIKDSGILPLVDIFFRLFIFEVSVLVTIVGSFGVLQGWSIIREFGRCSGFTWDQSLSSK